MRHRFFLFGSRVARRDSKLWGYARFRGEEHPETRDMNKRRRTYAFLPPRKVGRETVTAHVVAL